jgi:hypothetical protein
MQQTQSEYHATKQRRANITIIVIRIMRDDESVDKS